MALLCAHCTSAPPASASAPASALATTTTATQPRAELTDVPRILAFGDVHGAYDELRTLLANNGVIDANANWQAAGLHLVSLGDLVDRGPDSRAVMDLLMKLQGQARRAGGRVHVLLGNHEAMNLTGDLRDVSSAEYLAFAKDPLPPGIEAADPNQPAGYAQHGQAFAASGKYGAWLLARPTLIKLNDTLFVHGGLSPLTGELGITGTNNKVLEQIQAAQALAATGIDPNLSLPPVLDYPGPLWYRGSAQCHELLEESVLQRVLKQLDAARVVIGHTPTATRTVLQRFDNRVLAIDTGMLNAVYKGKAFLLELAGSDVRVLNTSGVASAPRWFHSLLVVPASAEPALAQALQSSPLTRTEAASTQYSITDAKGKTYKARFHPTSEHRARKAEALWRLDRMLDLHMVPITVARKIGRKWGYMEIVPGRWRTEAERQEQQLSRPNFCQTDSEFDLSLAFDALTRSSARSAQTLHYRLASWSIRLGDQGTSFPKSKRLFTHGSPTLLPQAFAQRLQQLTPNTIRANLDTLLTAKEQQTLLLRRDKIMDWTRVPRR